jgi:hypothetical protein
VATDAELAGTSAFLRREFAAAKFANPEYLRWYYTANPDGEAVARCRDDERGPLATYALVPQRWRRGDTRALLGITVNACVRRDAQRHGVFTDLANEVFGAASAAGVEGTLTIANANSTPAFIDRLDFTPVAPLPVRALRPVGAARGVEWPAIDDAVLRSLAGDCAARHVDGWVHDWTFESLRWRLANPAAEYRICRDDRVWCVSTVQRVARLRLAVVLALVPRPGASRPPAGAVVAATCRSWRAAGAVYAGRNPLVRVRGLPLPRRVLPSPLNLLARGFTRPTPTLTDVAVYEFLDTDHY